MSLIYLTTFGGKTRNDGNGNEDGNGNGNGNGNGMVSYQLSGDHPSRH